MYHDSTDTRVVSDTELAQLVDHSLSISDLNDDGYLTYAEYARNTRVFKGEPD
ncbi:hypothetical protein MSG28_016220 [Choristoneura fumiferana]|uniref:Uncharacterized protein n=1 Tax=Choristoneura fumiferana TaxID=7141 RepID=A0ACC0K5Z2_CHOFU|nr:hypothetical protein MSG28_016220 [Choristoneura fumiferana]